MRTTWGTMMIVASIAATASGCDKLLATVMGVTMITASPEIDQAQGWDTDLATPLAGVMADDSMKGATLAGVALGERESATSTETPTPLGGADVSVSFGSAQVSLCEGDEGSYATTSIPAGECGDPALDYVEGELYVTDIETSDDVFTIEIEAPPQIPATSVDFTPAFGNHTAGALSLLQHNLNTALGLDWSGDSTASDNNTFVTLLRINFYGDPGVPADYTVGSNWGADPDNPIYDNAPRDSGAMIDIVTQAPETSATIDAGAFDTVGLYVLIVSNVELSTKTSSNLSIGSAALAGKGQSWIFWVD
jgi:hypothetical protein